MHLLHKYSDYGLLRVLETDTDGSEIMLLPSSDMFHRNICIICCLFYNDVSA
jgi:hypothetical protein